MAKWEQTDLEDELDDDGDVTFEPDEELLDEIEDDEDEDDLDDEDDIDFDDDDEEDLDDLDDDEPVRDIDGRLR